MEKDTKKDLILAGATFTGILAGLSPLALAAAGALVATGWNQVARGAQRRAERLVQYMIVGDEEPEHFAKQLQARVEAEQPDDALLAGFRALLMSAVQAVTPEALPAMGFIGRRYFRGECTLHDARAALRVLDIVNVLELQNLRRLMVELVPLEADVGVFGGFTSTNASASWEARARRDGEPGEVRSITPFAGEAHLFTAMKRAGAGTETSAFGFGGNHRVIELERSIVVLFHDALSFQPE